MIIHISHERWNNIRSQGYSLGFFVPDGSGPLVPQDGDAHFHLMDSEREYCKDCGKTFDSIKAETPVDIERYKAKLSFEAKNAEMGRS